MPKNIPSSRSTAGSNVELQYYCIENLHASAPGKDTISPIANPTTHNARYYFLSSTSSVVTSTTSGATPIDTNVKIMRMATPFNLNVNANFEQSQEIRASRQRGSSEVTNISPQQNFNYELGYNTHDDLFQSAMGNTIDENKAITAVSIALETETDVVKDYDGNDTMTGRISITVTDGNNLSDADKAKLFPLNTYLALQSNPNAAGNSTKFHCRILSRVEAQVVATNDLKITLTLEGLSDQIANRTVTLSDVLILFNGFANYYAGDMVLYSGDPYYSTQDRDDTITAVPGDTGSRFTAITEFARSGEAINVGDVRKYIDGSVIRYARAYKPLTAEQATAATVPISGTEDTYSMSWSLNNEYGAEGVSTYNTGTYSFHDDVAFLSRVNGNTTDPITGNILYYNDAHKEYFNVQTYMGNANIYDSSFVSYNSMYYRAKQTTEFSNELPTVGDPYWEQITITDIANFPRIYDVGDVVRDSGTLRLVETGDDTTTATFTDFLELGDSSTPRLFTAQRPGRYLDDGETLGGSSLSLTGNYRILVDIPFNNPTQADAATLPSLVDEIANLRFYYYVTGHGLNDIDDYIGSFTNLSNYIASRGAVTGVTEINSTNVDHSSVRVLFIIWDEPSNLNGPIRYKVLNDSGSLGFTQVSQATSFTYTLEQGVDYIVMSAASNATSRLRGVQQTLSRAAIYRGSQANGDVNFTLNNLGATNLVVSLRNSVPDDEESATIADVSIVTGESFEFRSVAVFWNGYATQRLAQVAPDRVYTLGVDIADVQTVYRTQTTIPTNSNYFIAFDDTDYYLPAIAVQDYTPPTSFTAMTYVRGPMSTNMDEFYYVLQDNADTDFTSMTNFRMITADSFTGGAHFNFHVGDIFRVPDTDDEYRIAIQDGNTSGIAIDNDMYFMDYTFDWYGITRFSTSTQYAVNDHALTPSGLLLKCLVAGTYTEAQFIDDGVNWQAVAIRNNSNIFNTIFSSYSPSFVDGSDYAVGSGIAYLGGRYWLKNTVLNATSTPNLATTDYGIIRDYSHANIGQNDLYNTDAASNIVIAYKSTNSDVVTYYRFFNPVFNQISGSSINQFLHYMNSYNIFESGASVPAATNTPTHSGTRIWVTYVDLATAEAHASLVAITDGAARANALRAGLLTPFMATGGNPPSTALSFGTNFVPEANSSWTPASVFADGTSYAIGDYFHNDGILYETVFARSGGGGAVPKRFPIGQAPDATFWARPLVTRMAIKASDATDASTRSFVENTTSHSMAATAQQHTENLLVSGTGEYLGEASSGLQFKYSNRYLRNGEDSYYWNMEFRSGGRYFAFYNAVLSQLSMNMGVDTNTIVSGTANFVFNIGNTINIEDGDDSTVDSFINPTINTDLGDPNNLTNRPFSTGARVRNFYLRRVAAGTLNTTESIRKEIALDDIGFTTFNITMNLNVSDIRAIGHGGRFDARPGIFDLTANIEILAGNNDPFFEMILNTDTNNFEMAVEMIDPHGNTIIFTFPSFKVYSPALNITGSEAPQIATFELRADSVNIYNTTMQIDYIPNNIE